MSADRSVRRQPREDLALRQYFNALYFVLMGEFLDSYGEIDKHGYHLPHWQQEAVMQFVTFRLSDALPQEKLSLWRQQRDDWLRKNPEPWDLATKKEYHHLFTSALENHLDQGYGSCLFRSPTNRETLENVLTFDEGEKVQHLAWVIMPNHVHLLFAPKAAAVSMLIKSWKGISSRRLGKGSIWQKTYYDTLIRDSQHFENSVRYIRRNPASLPPNTFTLWESERALGVP